MTSFKRINANDAKTLIAQGNSQVIDIRDAMSFQMSHIANATRVDNHNISQFMTQADLEAPLIVCCYHGNSSQGAASYFGEQGFKNAYSLDGGFEEWKVIYPEDCES